MKSLALFLFWFLFLGAAKPDPASFLYSLSMDLNQYEEVNSIRKIPKIVLKEINDWKIKNIYPEFEEPPTKNERRWMKFDLADVGKPYNMGCIIEKHLPFRQLKFAANLNSKWVIAYNHGQGRSHSKKLLFIDLYEPNRITVIYLGSGIDNLKKLITHLIHFPSLSKKKLKNTVYIFQGNPYPNWLDYDEIWF